MNTAGARAVLIVFGGLSGTGKTSLARELATRMRAVYLRIDSIEQAIRDTWGTGEAIGEEGYRVAYAVAEDNLRAGCTVIADSVNPLQETRDAWEAVAVRRGAALAEVEVTCSDAAEHRRRVEARQADIPGLKLPGWEQVRTREYEPWHRDRIVIDTAHRAFADCMQLLESEIGNRLLPGSR
jgi:predicted kinase